MSQQQQTPVEEVLSTVQVTHIVSIIAILSAVIAVNAIYLYYNAPVLNVSNNVFYLTLFDVAGVVGMSYYATQLAVGMTGITVQTQPATPSPAASLAGSSLSTQQLSAIGPAVDAYLAAKAAQAAQPPAAGA